MQLVHHTLPKWLLKANVHDNIDVYNINREKWEIATIKSIKLRLLSNSKWSKMVINFHNDFLSYNQDIVLCFKNIKSPNINENTDLLVQWNPQQNILQNHGKHKVRRGYTTSFDTTTINKLNTYTLKHYYLHDASAQVCSALRTYRTCYRCKNECCARCNVCRIRKRKQNYYYCSECIVIQSYSSIYNSVLESTKIYNLYPLIVRFITDYSVGIILKCCNSCNNHILINNKFELKINRDMDGKAIYKYYVRRTNMNIDDLQIEVAYKKCLRIFCAYCTQSELIYCNHCNHKEIEGHICLDVSNRLQCKLCKTFVEPENIENDKCKSCIMDHEFNWMFNNIAKSTKCFNQNKKIIQIITSYAIGYIVNCSNINQCENLIHINNKWEFRSLQKSNHCKIIRKGNNLNDTCKIYRKYVKFRCNNCSKSVTCKICFNYFSKSYGLYKQKICVNCETSRQIKLIKNALFEACIAYIFGEQIVNTIALYSVGYIFKCGNCSNKIHFNDVTELNNNIDMYGNKVYSYQVYKSYMKKKEIEVNYVNGEYRRCFCSYCTSRKLFQCSYIPYYKYYRSSEPCYGYKYFNRRCRHLETNKYCYNHSDKDIQFKQYDRSTLCRSHQNECNVYYGQTFLCEILDFGEFDSLVYVKRMNRLYWNKQNVKTIPEYNILSDLNIKQEADLFNENKINIQRKRRIYRSINGKRRKRKKRYKKQMIRNKKQKYKSYLQSKREKRRTIVDLKHLIRMQ